MFSIVTVALLALPADGAAVGSATSSALVRSAGDGRWSDPATWEGGKTPSTGARVQVRAGHMVIFDVKTDGPIRSIHVAGTMRFDPDRDTRLDVGLIKIQAGDDAGESGFQCESHQISPDPGKSRPALEMGTRERPIAADRLALVRLTYVAGLDPEQCPGIVCCGGRWDVHGSAMSRTWVKLGATADKGSARVKLSEPVTGWRVGDRIIITATERQRVRDDIEIPSIGDHGQTEERIIRAIEGRDLVVDAPLAHAHTCFANRRGEVANLSRNVVIESAHPDGNRGHTMYHRDSTGAISFAEFRDLGKEGRLGKYSLHFHRAGDTMRGSSVIGASIWNSANRWITIHGTNTLVVRDCVGYRSKGHGFFIEDGTEVDNILERNLAVQACAGKPLPDQVFATDRNDGSGFWWANSRNAFIGNVAVECDEYGFRFDAPEAPGVELVLPVRGSDGVRRPSDIRTLSFLRFERNEAHAQRRYGVNLGGGVGHENAGGVGQVGPDFSHPFLIQKLHIWDSHWALSPAGPGVLVDGLDVAECTYGLWRAHFEGQAYRGLAFFRTRLPSAQGIGRQPDQRKYPRPLTPIDDRPPVTVIISIIPAGDRHVLVRGTSVDDGQIERVRVNDQEANSLAANFLNWEVRLEKPPTSPFTVTAIAQDAAGNRERLPCRVTLAVR